MVRDQWRGWEKVVFLSSLDTYRNKSEISKIWEVSVSGGPLYREMAKQGIREYEVQGLLDERGSTFKAEIQSEEFKNELRNYFLSEDFEGVNKEVGKDIDEFIDFLNQETIKEELLNPQIIKNFFKGHEDPREHKIGKYFACLLYSASRIWVHHRIENMDGLDVTRQGDVISYFTDFNDNLSRVSSYDVEELNSKMLSLYRRDNSLFDFIIQKYDNAYR